MQVTCPDCNFNYTQIVCKDCGHEHIPKDDKKACIVDGRPINTWDSKN